VAEVHGARRLAAEELAAATGEPVDRLAAFAQAGLLLRRADGRYEASITPPTG
jgi:hypothetical protein